MKTLTRLDHHSFSYMELKQGLMRLVVHKNSGDKLAEIDVITNPRSPSSTNTAQEIPTEFVCPISGSLMSDPVIVQSGHTFERVCVRLCKALDFTPRHLLNVDSSVSDLTSVMIPNLALKTTILNWCRNYNIAPPSPPDLIAAERLVRASMEASGCRKFDVADWVTSDDVSLIRGVEETPKVTFNHAATELSYRKTHFRSGSDETVNALTPPLPFATQPSCYSSSPSSSSSTNSENETLASSDIGDEEHGKIVAGMRSANLTEVESALTSLRRMTRVKESTRAHLCSARLLSALKGLVVSRHVAIQTNSLAALVNLSLEKSNKIKIVRSGILPPIIDVLKKAVSAEAKEHACGVVFSLALDDDCKTAIGVLGALPPLLDLMSSSDDAIGDNRTKHDAALAVYHLTLVQSNRSKLVKLGAVQMLLRMVRLGRMAGRVLLILGNLSWCGAGRAAMLDCGAVECLVAALRGKEMDSLLNQEMDSLSNQESCVAALYGLSHGGLRFKGLAKAAGAVEVLREVERTGSERGREKARRILEMMRGREKEEEEEEVDWEALLDSGFGNRARFQPVDGGGLRGSCVNSSEF